MNLNDRIEASKPYFLQFQILAEEDAIYVIAKFPQSWTIPDTDALKKSYNVEIAPVNGAVCFATEIKNGTDCVFDALDYVIKFNKCVEERKELLINKVNELKTLFASEELEKLKTLVFTFEEPKKPKTRKTQKAQETVQTVLNNASDSTDSEEENNIAEEKVETASIEDSSLMSFAKDITED